VGAAVLPHPPAVRELGGADTMHRMRKLLILDIVAVLAFVALGRQTHDEGNALVDFAGTAAPFLIGLALGWIAARSWRVPLEARSGLAVAGVTVAAGMALRRILFQDGTATAFVLVAVAFTFATMSGWRLLARRLLDTRRTSAV